MTAVLAQSQALLDRIAQAAYWLVVMAALAVLATMTARAVWLALEGAGHEVVVPTASTTEAFEDLAAVDFSILERATPFASSPAEFIATDTESINAAETSLNLTLHGVLITADGGAAYISVGDAPQKSFRVGDVLGSNRAELERIYSDGVLLRRDGILEKLLRSEASAIVTLGQGETSADTAGVDEVSSTPEETAPPAQAEAEIRQLQAFLSRREVLELASSIRLDPNTGDVQQGFTVFPVRNADLMARAGLRPGDVVQRLGGVALNDETDLARILADIERETEITIGLVRSGEAAILRVRLSED